MPFVVTADFRFGTYTGRKRSGSPEPHPTPARLYSALVDAAYGSTGGPLRPATRAALDWMERRRPDAVSLPTARPNWSTGIVAYREKGLRRGDSISKKESELATRSTALAGPVQWWWADEPDPAIADELARLCAEVPYLGEVASSVRLGVGEAPAIPEDALRKVVDDSLDSLTDATLLDTVRPGRLDELDGLHSRRRPLRGHRDSNSGSEKEEIVQDPAARLEQTAYRRVQSERVSRLPWNTGLLIEVLPDRGTTWPPRPEDMVGWSVAMHRTLVRVLDVDAPALVTGHYEGSQRPPANRLAIQILPPSGPHDPERSEGAARSGGILLLSPAGADPDDLELVERAMRRIRRVVNGRAGSVRAGDVLRIDTAEFWAPPVAGLVRWWRPTPFAIAETRPLRSRGNQPWSAADALLLGVGFVWRNHFESVQPGEAGYRQLAQFASERGVRVAGARSVQPLRPYRYAHRTNPSSVITPLTGLLRIPDLLLDTALCAVGQSRHLGGGLLIPHDVPAVEADV